MRIAYYLKQFRKDYKRESRKQGKIFYLMKKIKTNHMLEKVIYKKYKDHLLKGSYKGRRELHIKPDWLLIYRYGIDDNQKKAIYFERTGSHSDLFD